MVGYVTEIIANQIHDRRMLGRLLDIGEKGLLGIGHIATDSAFHGITADDTILDTHKRLGRETYESVLDPQSVSCLGKQEDVA